MIQQMPKQFEVEAGESAVRIFLKLGRSIRTFILQHPPYPTVGDFVKYSGHRWEVWKIEPAEVILQVKAGR